MINQILDENNDWIDGEPTIEGQKFRNKIDVGNSNFGYEETAYSVPQASKPTFSLTNVSVVAEGAKKVGEIWWLPTNTIFTLTANVSLEDLEMMVIVEQVVRLDDGSYNVVNDKRIPASIIGGVVTVKGQFKNDGNYRITAERLNLGLNEVKAPFNLSFDLIEFDAYENLI